MWSILLIHLETQERSVGWGKTVVKVFKKGEESPWDATLNEPVPRLIRMLILFALKSNVILRQGLN